MAFKSEIHVAELASIRTGHTEGDIYYILDNGMLDDLPCKPGTFVKWHNDDWQIQPNEHYALASAVDGEIAQAIDNLLDDDATSETVVAAVPSSQSSDYIVGNYYEVQGKVAKLRTKTEGDNVTQLTFDTTSGLLEAINNNSGKIAVFECTYSQEAQGYTYPTYDELTDVIQAGKLPVIVEISAVGGRTYFVATFLSSYMEVRYHFVSAETGRMLKLEGTTDLVWSRSSVYDDTLSSTSTNAVQNRVLWNTIGSVKNGGSVAQGDGYASVENNSLTTITGVNVAALQVSVSFDDGSTEVPNFALEIDPTVDCTLTLKKYVGSSPLTLTPSVAGGNVMTAGKHYQVTCVGSCWTLAEFAMPNP